MNLRAQRTVARVVVAAAVFVMPASVATAGGSRTSVQPGTNGRIAFVRQVPPLKPRCGSNSFTTTIWTINPDGSGLEALTTPNRQCTPDTAPDWSPDGRHLAFMRGAILMTMDADGGNERALYKTAGGFINVEVRPSWSPDGKRILFLDEIVRMTRNGPKSGGFVLRTIKPDGKGLRSLFRVAASRLVVSPRWSPRGDLIAFYNQRGLQVIRFNGSGRRTLFVPPASRRGCTDQLTLNWSDFPTGFDWSPDGRRLVFVVTRDEFVTAAPGQCAHTANGSALMTVVASDGGTRQIAMFPSEAPDYARYDRPVWSPDGTSILLTRSWRDPNQPPYGTLVIANADGGVPQEVGPAEDGCRITPTERGRPTYACPALDGAWQPH